jgi:phosphoribosylglycinamide formyltransferase-1
VGVLASGSGSNFEALVHRCRQADAPCCEVVQLIVNRPGCGAIERARDLGVPCELLDHTQYPSREALDRAVVETLQHRNVELVVMAGWMRVVTLVLIEAFPQRLLNIHPSLLPQFRGMHAIRQALEAGVSQTGCTVHDVVQDVDAGPILGQREVPVLPDDTESSLSERIHAAEHQLLPQMVMQRAAELLLQAAQG